MQECATLIVKLLMLDGDILAYSGEFRELHSLQVCSLPLSPKSREKVLKYKTNYVHTD